MHILFSVLILWSASLSSFAAILPESVSVLPHPRPGITDRTQLNPPGIQFHEFNDYLGDTDKLITGGARIKGKGIWPHFSSSLSVGGAYIMPIHKTRSDQPALANKIGIHAETLEVDLDFSYTGYGGVDSWWAYRIDLGIGHFKLGEFGMVNIYRQVHRALGSPILDDEFGEKRKEEFWASNYGLSLIFGPAKFFNFSLGASVYNSVAFYEVAYEASLIMRFSLDYALSLKYAHIDQKNSEWWSFRPNRQHYLVGLRLFTYWTPSAMYVSPYVEGDDFGQTYFSPVSFTIPLE